MWRHEEADNVRIVGKVKGSVGVKKIIIVLFLLGLLTRVCFAQQVEMFFQGYEKKKVIDATVNAILNEGYSIITVTDYQVIARKTITNNLAASFLYGSRYNINPEYRFFVSFADYNNSSVRAVAEIQIITNPGSAFEKPNEFNDKTLPNIYPRIKSQLELNKTVNDSTKSINSADPRYGFDCTRDTAQPIKVTSVSANSIADRQGLRVGDIIKSINKRFTSTLSEAELNSFLSGPIGSKVVLTIWRVGGVDLFDITLEKTGSAFEKYHFSCI